MRRNDMYKRETSKKFQVPNFLIDRFSTSSATNNAKCCKTPLKVETLDVRPRAKSALLVHCRGLGKPMGYPTDTGLGLGPGLRILTQPKPGPATGYP